MSEPTSGGGSRLFMMGALVVMVLGLTWSGWQWMQGQKRTAAPAPVAPAAAPAETTPPESSAPPAQEPVNDGVILSG